MESRLKHAIAYVRIFTDITTDGKMPSCVTAGLSDVMPKHSCNIKAYIKAPIFWKKKQCRLVYVKRIVGRAYLHERQ